MSKNNNPPSHRGCPPEHDVTNFDEDEELVQQCIEVIRQERRAGCSILQRRLKLGYTRAARIMDELERRGLIGPSKGPEPREILFDLPPVAAAPPTIEERHLPAQALGNRAAFLAGDPRAAAIHQASMAEFREKFTALVDGLKPALGGIIAKAEQLRLVGIVLNEWCENSLPGGKLTRDFYEQHKAEFVDARGQTASYEFLEAAIRAAKENLTPIDSLHTALKYKQPMLLATGDVQFALESERPPQNAAPPADPLVQVKKLLNPGDFISAIKKLRENPNYYMDGQIRPSLKLTLAEEWKPTFAALDELRRELGI